MALGINVYKGAALMKLSIQLFAGLAEQIGAPGIIIETGKSPVTAGELKLIILNQYGALCPSVAVSFIAVNQSYAAENDLLTEADEIALIPPVSGGQAIQINSQDEIPFTITSDPLIPDKITAQV